MSSLNIKYILLFIVFFIIGFGGIFFYTTKTSEKKAEERKVIASKSAFSLENAPKATIRGEITNLTGDVLWTSRIATEPATLTETTPIQQAEIIETTATGEVIVSFPALGKFSMEPESRVSIIRTLPTSFVLIQPTGSVTYTSENASTISVRTLRLLSSIKGEAVITVDSDEGVVEVSVLDGDATIGYNDSDITSQVRVVSKGETAVFDNESREATIE